ncbi:MAG: C25 family cysteine peptidase [bacterium]
MISALRSPMIENARVAVVLLLLIVITTAYGETIRFENNWGAIGFNLIEQNATSVEVIFSVTQMDLSQRQICGQLMDEVTLPGCFLPRDAGEPNLPGTGRYLALPQGAWAEFELLAYRTEIFHDVNVSPAFAIPLDSDTSALRYSRNPGIYTTDDWYPREPFRLSEPTKNRGLDVVILGVTPFQYNPVTRDLLVYQDVRIRVSFYGGNGHFGEDRLRSRWWEPVLRQNVLNYSSLPQINFDQTYAGDDDNVEYLIIVPDDPYFIAWADTIKNWRNQQGIRTGITTLTQLGGNNATLIRNYLRNAYTTWSIPPVAVLLLSDYQNTGDQYGITSGNYNDIISDNYYADMDDNGLPDICVARITAQNDVDLENIIEKMLIHERSPTKNIDYYQHPVAVGGWQTNTWFILCDEVIAGFLHNQLLKLPKREYTIYSGTPGAIWSSNVNTSMVVNYFGPGGLNYIPATPAYLTDWGGDAHRINTDFNSGTFLVQYRGHGSVSGWETPSYQISDLSDLHNEAQPYVFSVNCLTGKFTHPSACFAEAIHRMKYGALGVLAASNASYSFVNDVFVWGAYDCMWPNFDPNYGFDPIGESNQCPGIANVGGKYYLSASSWPSNAQLKTITYYLFHHHGDVFLTFNTEVPTALQVVHHPTITEGATAFLVNSEVGSLVGLSVDGVLLASSSGVGASIPILIPPLSANQVLRITATKVNRLRYIADVPVVPAMSAYVVYDSCTVNDALLGNNNGQWDFGERVNLSIEMINTGQSNATKVRVTLSTSDSLITVVDALENYGLINSGASVTVANGFAVEANSAVPDQHVVLFTLHTVSESSSWNSYFSLNVNAPELLLGEIVILDVSGNNDGVLDPGETASLVVPLVNEGHSTAANIHTTLVCNYPLVQVSGNPGLYGTLGPNTTASHTYTVFAAPIIPINTPANFVLSISALGNYSTTDEFNLIVGDVRNLPSGPDSYGYFAWDDQDRLGGYQQNWVEIAPAAGGVGTNLNMVQDNQTITVNLPFTFRYYGENYNSISICSNGWLSMGTTNQNSWVHSNIPNSYGPPAMIAAFWDDLHPGYGGSEICYYWDQNNHYVVVEWYNVSHFALSCFRETFEVILYDPAFYPTTTGDGNILVHYLQVTDPEYTTFGIENRLQNVGIQYGFNNEYDVHAWPLESGRTIYYTTNSVDGWQDLTLKPTLGQIEIPACGGSFDFLVEFTNPDQATISGQIWCNITLPEGTVLEPVWGPEYLLLPARASKECQRWQNVPASAATGMYTFNAYVGLYPFIVWCKSSIIFEKLASGVGFQITDWANSGDPLGQWLTESQDGIIPQHHFLEQNCPNPFNLETCLRFGIPERCQVDLAVFDLLGRKVTQLLLSEQEAGIHTVSWNPNNLASGIYFYRIQAGEFVKTEKMVLLK